MNKFLILAGVLALTACTTTKTVTIDNTKIIVASPPKALFGCKTNIPIPKSETLTNKQVAAYINTLRTELQKCGVNMNKIEKYIAEMKKKYPSR